MIDDFGKQIDAILRNEFSDLTSKVIFEESCKKIGKHPAALTEKDLERLTKLMLSAALMFGGESKVENIKEKLNNLYQLY